MIETSSDLEKFYTEAKNSDLFLHVIPTEENIHPVLSVPSILFISVISTGNNYYYSYCHPDSISQINQEEFIKILNLIPNKKWVLDKKSFTQIAGISGVLDLNLVEYLKNNSITSAEEYHTPSHYLVKTHCIGYGKINLCIPLMKHLESFLELLCDVKNLIEGYEIDSSYLKFNNIIIETLGKIEQEGIFVNSEFSKHFNFKPQKSNFVYSQYNVYTSTGRPSNRFGGVNYASLNQSDGSRASFVSRYENDGKIVVVDYTAFHPRIICLLTKYPISTETDIYEYLARLYFQKKEIDETDIKNAKQLTFRQLYGEVEDQYSHIKYLSSLKTFIDEQWEFFQNNGYIITPFFNRKITTNHIKDPTPAKVFNYILQASEGEIALSKINEVQQYLSGKKTKGILYTYDSMLYDFHKEDGLETLNKIREIMSFKGIFPMKTYIGSSYQDIKLINM